MFCPMTTSRAHKADGLNFLRTKDRFQSCGLISIGGQDLLKLLIIQLMTVLAALSIQLMTVLAALSILHKIKT